MPADREAVSNMGPQEGSSSPIQRKAQVELTNVSDLKQLLERHGLAPTKRFGQHFLISPRAVNAIVGAACQDHPNGVLEIGPGPGVLTSNFDQFESVVALEIDPIAVSVLSETAPFAKVIHADVLKQDLGHILSEMPIPRTVVSNVPYNITGPLVTAIVRARQHWGRAVLMMQKEVVQKICAQPGDRNMGSISVYVQTRCEVKHVIHVPPGAFYPPPKVESSVVSLVPKAFFAPELDLFHERFVRAGFSAPRKTVENNLTHGLQVERAVIRTLLESQRLTSTVRPHELTVNQWEQLTLAYERNRTQATGD